VVTLLYVNPDGAINDWHHNCETRTTASHAFPQPKNNNPLFLWYDLYCGLNQYDNQNKYNNYHYGKDNPE
jgi:hypothetical protein